MVHVPDELRCLFSATVERRGDAYVIEVPDGEVERANVEPGETYRVAALGTVDRRSVEADGVTAVDDQEVPPPPVEEGDVRTVTVEATGDEGDGIAKVERGYVIIVQDGRPGEEVTVEVTTVRRNFAIARIVE